MIVGTTPESITAWILFLLASEWYEIAQQQSDDIYLSWSLPVDIQRHNKGMAYFTKSYLGRGLPLHRLLIAQHPYLTKGYWSVLSTTSTKLLRPPARIIVSL